MRAPEPKHAGYRDATKHTNTQTHKQWLKAVFGLMAMLLLGCQPSLNAEMAPDDYSTEVVSKESFAVDFGVILPGKPFYLCLPLSSVGLHRDDRIVSLDSSCDCVQLQVVSFRENNRGDMAPAILIETVPFDAADTPASPSAVSPARLRIEVEVVLAGNRTHRVDLHLIESELASDAEKRSNTS